MNPWYDIYGSNGDEAEAQGIEAARLAARTFVLEDGNESAKIKLDGSEMESCTVDEHGALTWRVSQRAEVGR